MIKVCFVCLGNICRSPMAELVFKDLAEKEGLSDKFEITSCGTSSCEAGSAIYPPIKRTLDSHRISGSHIARKITKTDLEDSDYILAMDGENIYELKCMSGGKYSDKMYKLCSFTDKPREREKYSCFCRLLRAAAPLPTRGIPATSKERIATFSTVAAPFSNI